MPQSLECKLVLIRVTRCRLKILISTSLIWTTGSLRNDVNVGGKVIKFAYLTTRNRSFARFVATVLVLSTGSLRNDESSGNDNATNQLFDWLNDEK